MPKGNSFPNSSFSYAVGKDYTTGNVYFVDSGATNASNGNDGLSPGSPLSSLNGAMDKVTASNGDIVFLMPGHAETVASATTQVIDVAGVKIVGIGVGASRPTFTFSATGSSFEIDAASTHIENVIFMAGISAVVVGVNVDAASVTLDSCEWNFSTTAFDFVIHVDCRGVDGTSITNSSFIAEAAAGSNEAIIIGDSDNVRIAGNYFFGDYAAGVIIDTSDVSVNLLIHDNVMYNADTAASPNGIVLVSADTGVISDNRIGTLQATDVYTLLDPGSCLCLENYAVNAIDESGVIIPATASTS